MAQYKKHITAAVIILLTLVAILGGILLREKSLAWLTLCITVLSMLPLFFSFERKKNKSGEIAVLAVMIAIAVAGRFLFAFLPGFKPITAIVILTGISLGKEQGFAVGALSAVVSNFYFGQGPWTPFQMLAWGLIGFLAGIFATSLQKYRWLLYLSGMIAGGLFSAIMDLWSTLWLGGTFSLSRYLAVTATSLPTTLGYVLSNLIFLILLTRPILQKLDRIKTKYGLFKISKKEGTQS